MAESDVARSDPGEIRKAPIWAWLMFVFVALFALFGYSMRAQGDEPFPALLQPGFGGVPMRDGVVSARQVEYTVTLDDGSVLDMSAERLLPESGGKRLSISLFLLNESNLSDPATRRWLASRVHAAVDGTATALTVTKMTVYTDVDDGSTRRRVTFRQTVPLPMVTS